MFPVAVNGHLPFSPNYNQSLGKNDRKYDFMDSKTVNFNSQIFSCPSINIFHESEIKTRLSNSTSMVSKNSNDISTKNSCSSMKSKFKAFIKKLSLKPNNTANKRSYINQTFDDINKNESTLTISESPLQRTGSLTPHHVSKLDKIIEEDYDVHNDLLKRRHSHILLCKRSAV